MLVLAQAHFVMEEFQDILRVFDSVCEEILYIEKNDIILNVQKLNFHYYLKVISG